ncbi:MAG: RDD family protein [Campylobacterota bacterium]|nr:RDD family protein [Campylobacterota bacterium]
MDEKIEELLYRENLKLASINKRAFALFIDEMLISILLIIILWNSYSSAKTTEDIIYLTNSFLLEYMAIKIIYQTFFVYQYGASIGKIIMKIRVCDLTTVSNPPLLLAFNRAIFRVISESLMYIGFIWGVFDPARQTWHDKTARSIVVDV